MSYSDVLLTVQVIVIVTGAIYLYLLSRNIKKQAKEALFEGIDEAIPAIKVLAEEWLNSEKGQKALFAIGGLIGNGAKSGFGLNKKGGKFSLQGLITDLAGQYLQRNMSQNEQVTPSGEGLPVQG